MKMNRFIGVITAVLVLLLVSGNPCFAQKMKLDEYKAQLAEYQKREMDAKTKIAALQTENEQLRQQIADLQKQIDATWEEIYAAIGTDKATVEAFRAELAGIGAKLDELEALSPEDLYARKEELCALKKQIAEAKTNKLLILTEFENKIAELEAKVAALEAKLVGKYDQYTVLKGDYLWKIAKKPEIYNDPYQWIRIYCVNRDQIKNPDLIYPDQVLKIQRTLDKDQYLVAKGDFLKKIAGNPSVYNDPTQWTKLYEANKDIISDPNRIYPYQVLVVPVK